MKKFNDALKEYVRRLNDDDLKYIGIRLANRLGGDLGEAAEVVQRNPEMDRWLSAANSADDFFTMIDQVDLSVQLEAKKRFGGYEQREKPKFR